MNDLTRYRIAKIRRRWLPALILCLFCSFVPSSLHAIDIQQHDWGFNGQVIPDKFNILTLIVNNPAPEPFDGVFELQHGLRIGRSGEVIQVPVFIGPGETRAVQLYPYISTFGINEQWTVFWPKGSFDLTPPREGAAGKIAVWLEDSRSISPTGGGLKRFPAESFPPFSTATDALHIVAMDEAPRWDQPRRQAFLEWLYRGGELHLYRAANDQYPLFTAELAVLNSPLERQLVGQGVVTRHPQRRAEAAPLLDQNKPPANQVDRQQITFASEETDRNIQQTLRKTVDPQHLWGLIWTMAAVYLFCVFPGAFILGRKTRDYRIVFAAELGVAALFSFGFSVVGRRGYNETSTNSAVAIARPVGPDLWDVSLVSNIFVTNGGDYDLTHSGKGVLFCTGDSSGERVRGYSRSGAEALFHVDIPPFSSRALRTKVQVSQPSLPLQLVKSSEASQSELMPGSFELLVGKEWPEKITRINVLKGDTLYALTRRNDRFIVQSNLPAQNVMTSNERFYRQGMNVGIPYGEQKKANSEELFNDLHAALLRQSATDWIRQRESSRNSNLARVLVYAPMPEAFFVKNPRVGKSSGRVLYTIDLLPSGAP